MSVIQDLRDYLQEESMSYNEPVEVVIPPGINYTKQLNYYSFTIILSKHHLNSMKSSSHC